MCNQNIGHIAYKTIFLKIMTVYRWGLSKASAGGALRLHAGIAVQVP